MMSRLTRSRSSNHQNIDTVVTDDENGDYNFPSTSTGNGRYLSQGSGENLMRKGSRSQNIISDGRNALSQGSIRKSLRRSQTDDLENTKSCKSISLQEEIDLAGKIIRLLFVAEKKKHVVRKSQIVKDVLGGSSKNFPQIMEIVKTYLSKVFGYKLVDTGGSKFILVNEIKNDLPHLKFTKSIRAQQVLLFIVLAQLFMHQDACREEILWDFLRRLKIITEEDFHHEYFGDVKKLITVDFVTQHYLERNVVDKTDSQKYEYKWGIRAEYEVSRRDVLKFVSEVYGDRPINTWPQQYKAMLDKENSEKS